MKKNNVSKSVLEVAQEQLKKHMAVFESLNNYDQGKKEISITELKKKFEDLNYVR